MTSPAPKKSLGQHWLYDKYSLEAICEAGELVQGDTVLEIGPGLGTLTALLVDRVDSVVAVEFDSYLAEDLPNRVRAKNLTVRHHDILTFNLNTLPKDYKIIANIPYYLTSNLIRVISESTNPPARAVLLVQKEVAERVAAKPGDMSLLSVSAQYFWNVSTSIEVPAKMFTPPPKIDSQILILDRRSASLFTDVDEQAFFGLVKAGFSSRRKTLLNSLSTGLRLSKQVTAESLEATGIASGLRPQALSLTEWHALYKAMKQIQAI